MVIDNEYVDVLRKKLKVLKIEILEKRNFARNILKEIDYKENQINNIINLLKAEGIKDLEIVGESEIKQLSEIAYELLKNNNKKAGVYYRDLADRIFEEGYYIPGKDPYANLLTHLNRDHRFVRVGRGIYSLKEWGHKPMKPRKRKGK